MLNTRKFIAILKVLLAVGLIAYLGYQAGKNNNFTVVYSQPKNWLLLFAAAAFLCAGILITFYRWYLLVRAIGISFRLKDALRLGAVGYLLNFVSLGTIGGDFFKAFFLAKEKPDNKSKAIASVVLDRLVGLYALMVVASLGILASGIRNHSRSIDIKRLCDVTLSITGIGGIAIILLFTPILINPRTIGAVSKVPLLGNILSLLLKTANTYRTHLPILMVAFGLSLLVHVCLTMTFVCISNGLPPKGPTFSEQFVICPLSMLAGALPLTPNGIGTLELAVEELYQFIPAGQDITKGTGTIFAFTYRLLTVFAASIGAILYLLSKREMDAVLQYEESQNDLASDSK